MVGVNGNGHHSREVLERAERRLAWTAIQKTLSAISDPELAGFLASTNTEAFERLGITNELISAAIGHPPDDDERARRLQRLFDLPYARKERLRAILKGGAE
jgi:hypothetical protein